MIGNFGLYFVQISLFLSVSFIVMKQRMNHPDSLLMRFQLLAQPYSYFYCRVTATFTLQIPLYLGNFNDSLFVKSIQYSSTCSWCQGCTFKWKGRYESLLMKLWSLVVPYRHSSSSWTWTMTHCIHHLVHMLDVNCTSYEMVYTSHCWWISSTWMVYTNLWLLPCQMSFKLIFSQTFVMCILILLLESGWSVPTIGGRL